MQRNRRKTVAARIRGAILAAAILCLLQTAHGARRITVAQLDKALSADDAVHRADADASRQVSEFEMTERLTPRALNHFATIHKLGPRTALALELVADQSAFLDPPASELPATEPPDTATQKQIIDAARAYSVQTWTRLPNFFVKRMTNRFDDGPHVLAKGEWPVRDGLFLVGTSSREVTFRDGKEVQEPTNETVTAAQKSPSEVGLRSWGEFGPALFVVLGDTAKGKIAFSHWEEIDTAASTSSGGSLSLAAVFHYSVPRSVSHYGVNYCCIRDAKSIGSPRVNYGGDRGGSSPYLANSVDFHPFVETPGYHGEIAIDPATGTVLRITIEAELGHDDPLLRAATAIEYGRVLLGDASYFCPIHSLALSMEGSSNLSTNQSGGDANQSANPVWVSPNMFGKGNPIQLINETRFVDYHRLGSTARILTDTANLGGSGAAGAPGQEADQKSEQQPAPETASANPPQPSAPSQPTSGNAAAITAPAAPSPATVSATTTAPAPPAEPAIPEVSMSAASGVPDQPTVAPAPTQDGYSLKVTSRLVDVGLVAYDKKGRPVTDLTSNDVEIYDDGHKQEIRSFGLATSAPSAPQNPAMATSAAPDTQEPTFANRAPAWPDASSTAPTSEIGSTVLVIDESHIAWNDMNYARDQVLKFLNTLKPGERVGLYTMAGLGFRVLTEVTTDHAALTARMQKFMPTAQSAQVAQEEETRNRQHFDEVHNAADLNSVNGNHTDVADAEQPVDPQLLTMGDNPARASFIILAQVARHLASIPGIKKLVWVSGDNVLADWRDQAVGIDKNPKEIAAFAMRAQEAMNEAHTAVYPFDISQLESGGVTADLQHQNVELTPAAGEAASLGGGATSSRNNGPGRIDAAMSQDIHPVQGPVRQVAAATGGRVIRRSGDLASQLDGIIADGHATYMLSFSPQGPADGQYHNLSVKLTGKRGLTLSYRTGYVFEKEPSTLKERFQQAVWRPADTSEIAVTANVSAASDGANLEINIATGDLGLQQQAGRWMDKLDIFFIRRDDAGLHAHIDGRSLGLKLKPTTYQKLLPEGIPFEHFIAAKPGAGSLRVLVVDENSGRMGSVTIPASAMGSGG